MPVLYQNLTAALYVLCAFIYGSCLVYIGRLLLRLLSS